METQTNDDAAQTEEAAEEAKPEAHPTIQEARAMFLENPGLSSVVTDEGNLFRDGTLVPAPAA